VRQISGGVSVDSAGYGPRHLGVHPSEMIGPS